MEQIQTENNNYNCPLKLYVITNDTFLNLMKQFSISYAITIGISFLMLMILYFMLKPQWCVFNSASIVWMCVIPIIFYFLFIEFLKVYSEKGELTF